MKNNRCVPVCWKFKTFEDSRYVINTIRACLKGVSIVEKVTVSRSTNHTYSLLDVSDFSIFKSEHGLLRCPSDKYSLINSKSDKARLSYKSKGKEKFWWDFTSPKVKRALKPLLGYRALQEVSFLQMRKWRFDIQCIGRKLNKKDKTANKLKISLFQFQHANYDEYLLLVENKTLSRKDVREKITEVGNSLLKIPTLEKIKSVPAYVMDQLILRPSFIDKKSNEEKINQCLSGLSEDLPSELIVRQACYALMNCVRQNEQGIIDDIDTEYLHQYRVHLRKIRSLINLFKKCFSPDVYLDLKSRLSSVASRTNALRDLDVFILKQHVKTGRQRPRQKVLYSKLAKKRNNAYLDLKQWLLSARYKKEMKELQSLLSKEPDYYNRFSKHSIGVVLQKLMLKKYEKIREKGMLFHKLESDESIHQLRIDGKKMRYLMEFYFEISPQRKSVVLLKRLKRLQNILGDYNDSSVQQEMLKSYQTMFEKSGHFKKQSSVMMSQLQTQHQDARKRIETSLDDFTSQPVYDAMKVLCHP